MKKICAMFYLKQKKKNLQIESQAYQNYLDTLSISLNEFEEKCVEHWNRNGSFNVLHYWKLKKIKNDKKNSINL
jgi:hypothetical protein